MLGFIFHIKYLLSMLYYHRTAATRCRQKKKLQVENMEKKTKDLQAQNKLLEVLDSNICTYIY